MPNSDHVVVLVHGIRDFAYWQVDVRQALEAHGFIVEMTNYERFDLLRFLAPVPWFRNAIIDRVWHQIEQVCKIHAGKKVSFIAHSFGTYVIAEIMRRRFNFAANRIIFCGSVARYDAPFEQVSHRFVAPLLNEVGTRDIWPAFAQSITFGYGSAGTYGFRRPYVRDRWHTCAGHGYFLNKGFCETFWVPFLETGDVAGSQTNPQLPVWWVRFLYVVQLRFVLLLLLSSSLYFVPWQRLDSRPVERWVETAEHARKNGTIHPSSPLPNDLVQARSAFEEWWQNTGLATRRKLQPDLAYKALSYNSRLYRMFERQDELKPGSSYWSEQCLFYFEQTQIADKITECLLDRAALFLELSQIEHTNTDNFRRIAESGDLVMNRAISLASDAQKPDAYRMASRFYYNLARPRDGMLSLRWDNNYLALAVKRAKQAYELDSANLLNITQMSRAVQRMAANPPQDGQANWTEDLRHVQKLMAAAYRARIGSLRTPEALIPPANILAVMTMDLALRDWRASPKAGANAEQGLALLKVDALPVQTDAWALVRATEWAKDYTFDLNYDLARIRSAAVQLLDADSNPQADGMFDDAIVDLKTAASAATATQLRAAFVSVDAEPSFAGLSEPRRARLKEIVSIK
jgi:pimeloyl-ACP methyl ester carboxylesterase